MDMWISYGEGFLLVFSIDNYDSFEATKSNYERIIKRKHGIYYPILLIGNKKDLENQRKVSYQEAKNLADTWGIEYMETSVKTNYNCDIAFEKLIEQIQILKYGKQKTKCCFFQ